MKKTRNTIILTGVMLFACLAALAWAKMQQKRVENFIHSQLKDAVLTANDRQILSEYAGVCRAEDSLLVRDYVRSRRADLKYVVRNLFLLGLYQRFCGSDSAEANLQLACQITHYLSPAQNSFLRQDGDFVLGLAENKLASKLCIEIDRKQRLHLKRSLRLCKKIGDRKRYLDFLSFHQYSLYSKGKNDRALQIGLDGVQISRAVGYEDGLFWFLNYNGSIKAKQDNYAAALAYYQTANSLAQHLGDTEYIYWTQWRAGGAWRRLGEFDKAIQAFDKAEAAASPSIKAKLYNDKALALKNIGHYTHAEKLHRQALALAESLACCVDAAADAHLNLAELYRLMGDYNDAIHEIQIAESLYVVTKQEARLLSTITIHGDIYLDQNQLPEAQKTYERALALFYKMPATSELGVRRHHAALLNSMAEVQVRKNNFPQAVQLHEEALDIYRELSLYGGTLQTLAGLCNIHCTTGDSSAARRSIEQAYAVKKSPDPYLESLIYYQDARLHIKSNQIDKARLLLQKAVGEIENTRARIDDEKKIDYFATAQNIYNELICLCEKQGDAPASFYYSEHAKARAFFEMMQHDLPPETPPALPQVHDIQARLLPGCELVSYKVTPHQVLIYHLQQNDFATFQVAISRDSLRTLVNRLATTIGARDYEAFVEKSNRDGKAAFAEFRAASKALYDLLWQPLAARFAENAVVCLVPDDILYQAPFAALMSPEDRFVIESHPLCYAPSAGLFVLCQDRLPASQTGLSFLGIANPSLDLPYSTIETRGVAGFFNNSRLLVEQNVNEDSVVAALNRGFDIIHLACHAVINEDFPKMSNFILGPNAEVKEPRTVRSGAAMRTNDNLLLAYEIENLDLHKTRFVNLSACRTAAGRYYSGEGVVGFTRAFMQAGAAAVLTSLWDIDDRHTKILMTEFYKNWQIAHLTLAHALQAAQLATINALRQDNLIRYPYPHKWAAFQLVGNYQ